MSQAGKNPSDPRISYQDRDFLSGDDARPLRILSEYLAPLATFREKKVHDTVVFFGSARQKEDGAFSRYYRDARELARLVTAWSKSLSAVDDRFIVCTGGGPGLMEAANRGAADAGGRTIGLNIGLPHEQSPNPYITPELNFEFHYFFMRKLWFAHLARAIVIFPGGFGTLDELFEILTLSQTGKLNRRIYVVLYGSDFWKEIINFEALERYGMISPGDMKLFRFADTPEDAFNHLQGVLPTDPEPIAPAFAKSKS